MLEKLQLLHLIFFISFFTFFWILEYLFPLRKKIESIKKRWIHNWSLSITNSLVSRFLLYVTPISVWLYLEEKEIWLFNLINLNFIFEIIITVILLDFFIYLQHILSHKLKWIWELHKIHHSDTDLDVTTALRFHTLEIILSLFIKIFFVIIFWFNAIWIVIFEIILVSSAMFNHSNLKLPQKLDKYLSFLIVTPRFHQVHHSVIQKQTDSNYWFFLSIWDRLCKTYTFHDFEVKKIWLDNVKDDISFRDIILLNIKK